MRKYSKNRFEISSSGLESQASRLALDVAHEPTIGRVNGERFLIDGLRLNHHLISTLGEAAKVMIDVMLYVPLVPVQLAIKRFHCPSTSYHECVCAIDIEWSVNALTDFLWRMLTGVEMLTSEICQSPIVRKLGHILL